MRTRILHVFTSPSFAQLTIDLFEQAAPGENRVAAVGFDGESVRDFAKVQVDRFTESREDLSKLSALVAESEIVIFHKLTEWTAQILRSAPKSVLKVWSGWGTDYYGTTFNALAGQLEPQTKKAAYRGLRPTFWLGRALFRFRFDKIFEAAASNSDVFSAPIPEDLSVFQKRFSSFSGKFSQLNYATLEDSIAETGPIRLGHDVLVGNSSSPTNNHIDVFSRLAKLNLEARKVVTPLSYGNRYYGAEVIKAGQRTLGDSFEPVEKFVPLDEYNKMLFRCSHFVFGSLRQEGLGNILRAIWQGSAIVLNPKNPLFSHLNENGVLVHSLDDLSRLGFSGTRVTENELPGRRKFLIERWSREVAINNIKNLLELA